MKYDEVEEATEGLDKVTMLQWLRVRIKDTLHLCHGKRAS